MNKEELKRLLNTVYEMEGLIELALKRDFDSTHSIYGLIADKSYAMANMAAEWNLPNSEFVVETPIENEAVDVEEKIVNDDESEEDKKMIEVFVENYLPKSSETEKLTDCDNYPPSDVAPQTQAIEDANAPLQQTEEAETEDMTTDEQDGEPVDDTPRIVSVEPYFEEINNTTLFDDDDFEHEAEFDDENGDDEDFADAETIFVDNAKNEAERIDIRTLFTLNDKFRFKRELFGNNNIEFTESLNLVQTMKSFDEAQDYFYNDLQWDSESEDVVEFMNIIARFFK